MKQPIIRSIALCVVAVLIHSSVVRAEDVAEPSAQPDPESDVAVVYEQAAEILRTNKGNPGATAFGIGLMRYAADQGHVGAMSAMGYFLSDGTLEKADYPAAVRYLSAAALAGDRPASINLRKLYESRLDNLPDSKRAALEGLRTAADQGQVPACAEYGRLVYFGAGDVAPDPKLALQYMKRAADSGDVQAMTAVGSLLASGAVGEADSAEAIGYIRKAAEGGDPRAQAKLGIAYVSGNGVPRDPLEAYKWMVLSTLQNEAMGRNALADYVRGLTKEQVEEGNQRVIAHERQMGKEVSLESLKESLLAPDPEK